MQWSVLREVGIQYAAPGGAGEETLECPTFAQRGPDGSTLIVDELATGKVIPFRFECRTLRIGADGRILYDTRAAGMGDGYGCLVDQDRIAILRRTCWELLIVGPRDEPVQEIHTLTNGSASVRLNRPRYAEVGEDGTLVIVDTGNNRVVAATAEGELIWELKQIPGSPLATLSQPRWARLVGRDEVIVCDHYHHRVLHMRVVLDRPAPHPDPLPHRVAGCVSIGCQRSSAATRRGRGDTGDDRGDGTRETIGQRGPTGVRKAGMGFLSISRLPPRFPLPRKLAAAGMKRAARR